jgi:hypothetical protein
MTTASSPGLQPPLVAWDEYLITGGAGGCRVTWIATTSHHRQIFPISVALAAAAPPGVQLGASELLSPGGVLQILLLG